MTLAILYRGPLASCNYGCDYCPFAKRRDDRDALTRDRAALDRFVAWVEAERALAPISVMFTPWGEALVHGYYRAAMQRLSRLDHVERVVAQTNLSCATDWLADADARRLALWATFHPGEIERARFVAKVHRVHAMGVRISVGVVGLPHHLDEARALRAELPAAVYLWINAAKRSHGTYAEELAAAFTAIDPHFRLGLVPHASVGHDCHAGEDAVSVDGDGTVRRCHFVAEPLGNLYDDSFRDRLARRACPQATCGCHIGYVHLARLGLRRTFAGGVLERIPASGVGP
jgi:hypothetical protein